MCGTNFRSGRTESKENGGEINDCRARLATSGTTKKKIEGARIADADRFPEAA